MVRLRCMVDNSVQRNSSLWGEHGVSFAIQSPMGRVLFDTGQSGEVLVHNAAEMKIDLAQFDALALSHAHYDHTGGLQRFLAIARPGIPIFANPGLFQDRFSVKEGQVQSIGMRLTHDQVSRQAALRLRAEPAEIIPGVWTTGEIPDRTEFEGSSPNLFVQDNGVMLPDPYRDDLSLVLDTDDGLVVVCGCCHAGLLNTMAHVLKAFHGPILAVVGGMHLASTAPDTLAHAVDVLNKDYSGKTLKLFPNHCTGERAFLALVQAFGDQVQPCPAGTELCFD